MIHFLIVNNEHNKLLQKNEGVRLKEESNRKSRTQRRQLKDKEEPVMSSTDSLTNAVASGYLNNCILANFSY